MLRWLVVAGGVASGVLGAVLMANPGRGAVGVAVVLGLAAVVWGLLYVIVGIVLRTGSPVTGRSATPAAG